MALILGSDGDVLSSMAIRNLLSELDSMIAAQTAYLMPSEHNSLISGIARELRDESAWEENTTREIHDLLENLQQAQDVSALYESSLPFRDQAEKYFRHRESVLAMHQFCGAFSETIIRRIISIFMQAGGGAPVPFSVCAIGNFGRGESTLSSLCPLLLVHENTDANGEEWFAGFAEKVSANLDRFGMLHDFVRIDDPEWRGGIDLWKSRVDSQAGTPDPSSETVSLCDLRSVYGDHRLGGGVKKAAVETLLASPDVMRSALRNASIIPIGFNFFGNLKVEKAGRHRGEFNLVQFALDPMVVTLRMLAIQKGIGETSTPDRIRKLQYAGELGVDLATRLLNTYKDFLRIKLFEELSGKGREKEGFYLDSEDLSRFDESCLKQGLDAIFSLQRIVYQNVES